MFQTLREIILERLDPYYTHALVTMVPKPLRVVMQDVLNMGFTEAPKYSKIRRILSKLLVEQMIE